MEFLLLVSKDIKFVRGTMALFFFFFVPDCIILIVDEKFEFLSANECGIIPLLILFRGTLIYI